MDPHVLFCADSGAPPPPNSKNTQHITGDLQEGFDLSFSPGSL